MSQKIQEHDESDRENSPVWLFIPLKDASVMFAVNIRTFDHVLLGHISISTTLQFPYRKGPCIPKDSIVVLKGINRIGKYLYFGHRKMVEEMTCERNCLRPREVGHNIKLLYSEDTEFFIDCELIEAVYLPSERKYHQEPSGVKIHQYTSLPIIHNPLPSEHFNPYRSEISRRSSLNGSSGNRHPAYSGYRRLSENSFYPDCRDSYLDSEDSVFGYSNGSRHFVSNNFHTDV
ncbi:hypothetical protein Anas_10138 [Armadillidium nasatum]|uniref:Uncharacterized protein n=1 Tax=Armadillidium nasatum TaxID=96803 RepID=A0A5N5SN82_9CRUS|nr:hypothetical protein Anas_10138 [Armadillidium nasatum]